MGEYVIDRDNVAVASTASRWWAFMAMGVGAVIVGVLLIANPDVAVETLVVLVALGLLLTGVGELLGLGRYRTTWSAIAGVALVAAGALALAWPGITLWALAVTTAVGLVLSGAARMSAGWMDRPAGWSWLVVGGALSVLVGLVALAWPGVTIVVLALLLGLRMTVFGVAEIAFALRLRDHRA